MQKSGQLVQSDFFNNTGGVNLSDSVFKIADEQASAGFNYDHTLTGGIKKRLGPGKVNTVADSQLRTLGLGLFNTTEGVKTVIRAAGTKLQNFDTSTPTFTALSEDTLAAGSDPFTSGSTQSVSFAQFNTATVDSLWAAGGGATLPVGVYSTTKFTENGVEAPAGVITAVETDTGGTFAAVGTYTYAISYIKNSTGAESNVSLDASATIDDVTDIVTLDLTGITGLDTTKISQIYIYRSTLNAGEGFTTGDLIAQLPSTDTSFVDTGIYVLTGENVPRNRNTLLDNSPLEDGTYNAITVFKRRLVAATGSTVQLSEVNKPESWPATNIIQVPSGGDITALGVVSFTSPQAQTLDELLVIFKERELWVITGEDYTDVSLKFIDQTGCSDQSMVVTANGFLSWVDYRGIYLWDGSSKPTYPSRPIEPLFAKGGDLDKSKFPIGVGAFFQKENHIIWFLSSRTFGEQKFSIKIDLRLTAPKIEQTLTGRSLDGVFVQDNYEFPTYAALSYIPESGSDEQLLLGDASGYCYHASTAFSDGGVAYDFQYRTKALNMENPTTYKLFHKVIVWVDNVGEWDLTLDYWSNYSVGTPYRASKALPISNSAQSSALWDIAVWDVSYWDDYEANVVPIIYNLEPGTANSNQGTSLQLQFRNNNANEPVAIHGFSVFWSELGGLTG